MGAAPSLKELYAKHDYSISEKLSGSHACRRYRQVCPHQSERNSYGTSDNRQESEERHQGASSRHKALSPFDFFFLYMQIFLNPVHSSECSDPIVKQSSEHIPQSTGNQQHPRFQSRHFKSTDNQFAVKRQYASGEQSRQEHAEVSVMH